MATKKKTPSVSSFWLRSYKLDKENKREAFIFFVQFIRWQFYFVGYADKIELNILY